MSVLRPTLKLPRPSSWSTRRSSCRRRSSSSRSPPRATASEDGEQDERERSLHGPSGGFRLWDENRGRFYFSTRARCRDACTRRAPRGAARRREAARSRARDAANRWRRRSRGRSTSERSPTSSSSRRACSKAAASRPRISGSSPSEASVDGEWRGGCRAWRCPSSRAAQARLRAKLSYTNVGFALAPGDVHDLGAARGVRRRARPRRLGDEPAARARAARRARARRGPACPGPRGRPARSALPLRLGRASR